MRFWKIAGYIIRIAIQLLNYWFFLIPSRFTIIAIAFYYFIIDYIIGDQPKHLFNRNLAEYGEFVAMSFWIFFGFPLLWSFICSMTGASMISRGSQSSSALKNTFKFRNGQMAIRSPKRAYEIFRKTADLDVLDKEENTFEKAIQGFNAKHGNKPPQAIYKDFMDEK